MNLTELTLGSLAVYRLSHLIAYEDGPGDFIAHLRERAGDSWRGKLMDCPFCLSVWIATPIALLFSKGLNDWLLNWLALSGAAVIIEKLTRKDT